MKVLKEIVALVISGFALRDSDYRQSIEWEKPWIHQKNFIDYLNFLNVILEFEYSKKPCKVCFYTLS